MNRQNNNYQSNLNLTNNENPYQLNSQSSAATFDPSFLKPQLAKLQMNNVPKTPLGDF